MSSSLIHRAYQLAYNAAVTQHHALYDEAERKLRTLDRTGEISPRQILIMRTMASARDGNTKTSRDLINDLGGPANADVQEIKQVLLTSAPEADMPRFRDFLEKAIPAVAPASDTASRSRRFWRIGVAAALVFVLVGGGGLYMFLTADDSHQSSNIFSSNETRNNRRLAPTQPIPKNASANERLYGRMRELACLIVLKLDILLDDGSTATAQFPIGSGFVISRDGLILTNRHVADVGSESMSQYSDVVGWGLSVVFVNDELQEFEGRVDRLSATVDLATIRIDAKFDHAVEFAPTPGAGKATFAFGFPGLAQDIAAELNARDAVERARALLAKIKRGEESKLEDWINPANVQLTMTAGIISRVVDTEQGLMLQTQTPIHPGNSGGPLVDDQGRVLGMVTLKATTAESVNMAIAGKTIHEELVRERGIAWPDDW